MTTLAEVGDYAFYRGGNPPQDAFLKPDPTASRAEWGSPPASNDSRFTMGAVTSACSASWAWR